ncbi:glycosyltransferase family 2 protein [Ramlibacter sp.]|uniref:glycosyltransferase family 2 protein n=1 Tax=Ramlibacter sp. TaxID=1917967 RepID=UPI002BAAD8FD|nr:glycosyltransferase family 2 protein [Ramlibacter sp.]HWI84196.1 glycosyltransferase family 2 protein [Ramlibacter sp.]
MLAERPAEPDPARPVCAVVVNWNGWRETVDCLRSLLAVRGNPLRVVVCDNGSSDDSAAQLARWLEDLWRGAGTRPANAALQAWCFEPCAGGAGFVRSVDLLCLGENLGYAGGLNAGIRWGTERFGAGSFWLLNNDVRVEPQALAALVAAKDAVPDAGLCGSVLLEWEPPHEVQAIGGIYRKALGVGWHLRQTAAGDAAKKVCLDIDYPVGASLFVEQDYLDRVGPMDDSYFLYYEEMDWVERGRRAGLRPVVALGSRVFHKEGASTGSHGGVRRKSLLSERYGVVNRLRITRKFWPVLVPLVWLSLWLVVLDRMLHCEIARAGLVVRLMFSPAQWLRAPQATARRLERAQSGPGWARSRMSSARNVRK